MLFNRLQQMLGRRLAKGACVAIAAACLLTSIPPALAMGANSSSSARGTAVAVGPPVALPGEEFTDIRGHWAEYIIRSMFQAGIVDPSPENLFRPDAKVTRLDFAVWTAKTLELGAQRPQQPPFTDWDAIPDQFKGYIAAMKSAGLLTGYPDGTFRPSSPITRAELGVIFGRALIKLGVEPELRFFKAFEDWETIPDWAYEASAAVKARVILGRPGRDMALFAPNDNTTRAEALTMIQRFMAKRMELQPPAAPEVYRPPAGKPIAAAYYVNTDDAYSSLLQNSKHIDMLVYASYMIARDGSLNGIDSPRTLQWGADNKKPVLVMFANHIQEANHGFLNDPAAQERAISAIAELVRNGYSGINLDFEYVPAEDRSRFTYFVRALASRLRPMGYLVTISVPAKARENLESNWVGAFDYEALGQICDYIMIMTYDQHWKGGPPGPIGSLPWMESVLQYACGEIRPEKILIGLPLYGYDWPLPASAADNSKPAARAIVAQGGLNLMAKWGVGSTWDREGAEETFTYVDEQGIRHVVYFNTPRSMEAKVPLQAKYGTAGIITWRLGYELPGTWDVISRALGRRS